MRSSALVAISLLAACSGAPRGGPAGAPSTMASPSGGGAGGGGDGTAPGGDGTAPGGDPAATGGPDDGAAAPAPSGGGGSLADAMVAAHNAVRAKHCAPPLAWSSQLAAVAQRWADHLRDANCAFEHSGGQYGENLAAGTSLDADGAVGMWYAEGAQYDFARGGFSMETGHFTQVVWKGSTRLGCGTSTCNGMTIVVCNYDPPGNMEGDFQRNVAAPGCH